MKQKEQVKQHLENYGQITSWEAIQTYGITRLAEYIRQLREDRINIETEYAKSDKGKAYGIYKLV